MNDEEKLLLADMLIALRKQLASKGPIAVQYDIVSDGLRVWTKKDSPGNFAEMVAVLIGGVVRDGGHA